MTDLQEVENKVATRVHTNNQPNDLESRMHKYYNNKLDIVIVHNVCQSSTEFYYLVCSFIGLNCHLYLDCSDIKGVVNFQVSLCTY